jgi:hypothetical protein
MAIRIFLNVWTEELLPDGGLYIKDPIDEALSNVSLSSEVVSSNYYGRISNNNRPDKLFLIKIMKGNLANNEWDYINAIPRVKMLPPMPFNTPIASISTTLKNNILKVLDSLGIPRTVYTSSTTIGGALRNILAEMNSEATSFGSIENTPDEWA